MSFDVRDIWHVHIMRARWEAETANRQGRVPPPGTAPPRAASGNGERSARASISGETATPAPPVSDLSGAASFSEQRPAAPSGRWLVAVAAILVQIAMGASQIWSVFRDPLAQVSGWTLPEVTLAYSINLFVSGFASCLGGIWMRRVGPRPLASVAGLLFGVGVALVCLSEGRLWLLYLAYGVIAGVGRGAAVVVAPSTLVRWFPEKRGLMAGLAGAGIGVGTLLLAPGAALLVRSVGVLPTFLVLGGGTLAVVLVAALALRNPPERYQPVGWTPPAQAHGAAQARSLSLRTALKTPSLYGLWALLFFTGLAGLALLSQAAPLAQELTGVSPQKAAGLVGVIGLMAAFGQVGWGWLSDRLGRRTVFGGMLLIQAVALLLLPQVQIYGVFLVLLSLILFCMGGSVGTMPAFAADYFGPRDLGAIFGFLLTALGTAALVGPLTIAGVRQWTGEYTLALYGLALVATLAVLLPIVLRAPRSARPPARRPHLTPAAVG